MSLKNKWRSRGSLQFRRESARYSDGSVQSGMDVLYIRIKGKACVTASFDKGTGPATGLWGNDGLYFKPINAVIAGKHLRRALHRRAIGESARTL